jgi:hypothetical protein
VVCVEVPNTYATTSMTEVAARDGDVLCPQASYLQYIGEAGGTCIGLACLPLTPVENIRVVGWLSVLCGGETGRGSGMLLRLQTTVHFLKCVSARTLRTPWHRHRDVPGPWTVLEVLRAVLPVRIGG